MTFAAACGDDDVQFPGVGGSAGRGGAAGAAGSAGDGGSAGSGGSSGNGGGAAGNGGSSGTGGSAGQGGTGGTGGAGGSSGTGGTGGTGGSDIPDAGPDAEPPPPDGGGEGSGACPDFAAAAALIDSTNDIVIARVIFDAGNDSAAVVLRLNGTEAFPFGDEMHLCSGPENCVELTDLDNLTTPGQETPPIIISDTVIAEGELAAMSNTPDVAAAFPFAYIAWGADFVSEDPIGGDASDVPAPMEDRADSNIWELGGRILPAVGDNAFIADGDSLLPEGFTTCTVE